jgi:undecaprenyl-diphosphatase
MSLSIRDNIFQGSTFQGLRSPGLFAKRPIIGLVLFLFGTLIFGALAYSLKTNKAFVQWDMGIATAFHVAEPNVPWPYMENLLFGFFLGKEMVIAIGVILAIYFIYKRFWRDLMLALISFSGGGLIWYFLSRYFDRPRPPYQLKDVLVLSDPSFPSGLALMAVICYGLLAYLLVPKMPSRFWKWVVAIVFTVVIIFVGVHCLMFGAHYVTDVIAGYALGLAWMGLVYTLVEKLFPEETARDPAGFVNRAPSQGLRTPGWFKERPIIGVAMVLLGGLSFAALAYNLVAHGPLIQLDMFMYKALLAEARAASPSVYEIMLFGFFVGKQLVQVIVTVLSIYFLYKRFWREFAMINISSAGGGLLWNFLINYFARPRPPEQTGLHITSIPTFPSGHALGVLICFAFLAYLLIPRMPSRFWKWTLGIVVLLIILFDGFSRVFQANHYLTDVLAGYALGIAWLGLVCTLIEVIFMRKKNEKTQQS